jgi:hypothetical protein
LACKLPEVWLAAFLELEAAATEATETEAIAADDEEAMEDVTASASVVSTTGLLSLGKLNDRERENTHELR